MKKEYTCVVCPEGCRITVDLDAGGKVVSVAGNNCRRGDAYVRQESVAPKRNISTTVALKGAERPVCPVKTSVPIPKEKIFEVMELCKRASVTAPVRIGDVIIKNVAGTGADILSTADIL
jgi:CxxC motif-containing protein